MFASTGALKAPKKKVAPELRKKFRLSSIRIHFELHCIRYLWIAMLGESWPSNAFECAFFQSAIGPAMNCSWKASAERESCSNSKTTAFALKYTVQAKH